MKLLNCKTCDDILKLSELRSRKCECGACTGSVDKQETPTVTGPARVFEIPWSEYDLVAAGEWHRWRMVPR